MVVPGRGKLVQQASGLKKLLPRKGPIWRTCYPLLCRGHGVAVPWEPEHMEAMLGIAAKARAGPKGERMALNRWFEYISCIPVHQQEWHSRCLLVLMIGMQLGLYRDRQEFPLWGGPKAANEVAGAMDEEEDQEG